MLKRQWVWYYEHNAYVMSYWTGELVWLQSTNIGHGALSL